MDKNSQYCQIFSEIAQGYSVESIGSNKFFFKHASLSEHYNIYSNYESFLKYAKNLGLQTETEKLEFAIENNWWTSEKESTLNSLNKTLSNLIITKSKLLYPSQKKEIEKQIKKIQSILITYQKERSEIIGHTIESLSNERFNDEMALSFIYLDNNLTKKAFENEDEYYLLEESDIDKIKNTFIKYNHIFSVSMLKIIAATGFFQNLVYLNNNPIDFWGKPVISCSKYQIDLLLYGKMFRQTIESYSKNGESISENILSDPEIFVEWFENKQSGSKNKFDNKLKKSKSAKNTVSSYVGATKEDLDSLGVKTEKIRGKSLLQLAEERGGVLEKNDYLNLR